MEGWEYWAWRELYGCGAPAGAVLWRCAAMIARRSFGASPRWSMPTAPFNACPGQPPRNCCHGPPSATIDRTGRRCPPGRLRRRALPSNPKGILSHSPRLAHQRLPWVIIPPTSSTPTGLRLMPPPPRFASANGALQPQPRPTAWVSSPINPRALKVANQTMSQSHARLCVHPLLGT